MNTINSKRNKNTINSKRNKYDYIILLFSLLSIIPLIFFILNVLDIVRISNIADVNDKIINDVLSKNLETPSLYIPFAIGVIIWFFNSLISAIAISKRYITRSYGYLSLFMGGLGIHAFFFLKSKGNTEKKSRGKILLISIIGLSTFSMSFFSHFKKSFDDPFIGEPIKYSLDATKPNLIEIFSDGFDRLNQENYDKDGSFNDFIWFDKFQTPGIVTHRTLPAIYSDFEKYNPFAIRKRHNLSAYDLSIKVYEESFLKAGIDHLSRDKNTFGQRNIINPITLSNNTLYGASSSGTPRGILALDSELNITNWSGARDFNTSKFGVSDLSPDANSYKYLRTNFNNTGQKGARVLMSDLLTHRPFLNTVDGKFSNSTASVKDSQDNLRNQLKMLFNALKNKDGAGNSIYDNTMIIVYGDHASHDHLFTDKDNYRKAESAMMIKYPKQNHSYTPKMEIIKDRVIYASSINNIISNYFNHPTIDQINYIKNNHIFDPNEERPVFISDDSFVMTRWNMSSSNSKLERVGNEVNYDEYYKHYKKDDKNQPLYKVVY